MDCGSVWELAPVRQTPAPGVVGVWSLLGRDVLHTLVLTPECVMLAGMDGQVAPGKKPGAAEIVSLAGTIFSGAPTYIWIAPTENLRPLSKMMTRRSEMSARRSKT